MRQTATATTATHERCDCRAYACTNCALWVEALHATHLRLGFSNCLCASWRILFQASYIHMISLATLHTLQSKYMACSRCRASSKHAPVSLCDKNAGQAFVPLAGHLVARTTLSFYATVQNQSRITPGPFPLG